MKSPLRYPGGKSKIADKLVSLIPDNICGYYEPFLGGGGVMLKVLEKYPNIPVEANDLDSELIGFWRALQNKDAAYDLKMMATHWRNTPEEVVRETIARWKQSKHLEPYQYYIINRCSFSGTIRMGGLSPGLTRFSQKQIDLLDKYNLGRVRFFNEAYDYFQLPSLFAFVDPPYYNIKKLYKHGDFDHEQLCDWLKKTGCWFLMTINDCPEIRAIFKGFDIQPLEFTYGMNNCSKEGKQKRGKELLIKNY